MKPPAVTTSSGPTETGRAGLVLVPTQLLFATDLNLGAGLVKKDKGVQ